MAFRNKENYNEYMRQYMLRRYHKRREEYLTLLGNKCVECGSLDDLEFDHIDPAGKAFEFAKALSGWSKARLDEEMKKAQILCQSCHIDKSKIDNKDICFQPGNKAWIKSHEAQGWK